MKYIIRGAPVPRKNPAPAKNYRGLYDTQKIQKEEYRFNLAYQHQRKPLIEPPIMARLDVFIAMPKSWGIKRKESLRGKLHTSKPDWSNCLKFIEDCCKGIIFNDDCQLSLFSGKKIWADEARTEFTLEHVDEANTP